jgi:hypothetical protein
MVSFLLYFEQNFDSTPVYIYSRLVACITARIHHVSSLRSPTLPIQDKLHALSTGLRINSHFCVFSSLILDSTREDDSE